MFEHSACIERDVLDACSVRWVGIANTSVVRADGLVDIAAEAVQQIAENKSGVRGEDFAVDGIHVEIARRTQPRRQLLVVTLVFQVELVRSAKSLARDLPRPDRVVAHENTLAATLQDDVATLRPLFPNGVREIAVHIHIVVFHGADSEKIIERQIVKMCDVENVGSQPKRLMMSERLRRARALANDAPVGLRFENEEIRKSGKQLKGRKGFQLLFGRNVVGVLEHAALLFGKSEILLGPGDKFVVRDEAVRFHAIEARNGGELIVFDEEENLVRGVLAGVTGCQKDFRSLVRVAAAEIFIAKEGFQLVVELGDFRRSHFV